MDADGMLGCDLEVPRWEREEREAWRERREGVVGREGV